MSAKDRCHYSGAVEQPIYNVGPQGSGGENGRKGISKCYV